MARRTRSDSPLWSWTSLPGSPESLPADWMDAYALLPNRRHNASRREAEDNAALAVAMLPLDRRAELLSAVPL